MKTVIILICIVTSQLCAISLPHRSQAHFSENMEYVVEINVSNASNVEDTFTIYSIKQLQKKDSLWSFTGNSRYQTVLITNDGNRILLAHYLTGGFISCYSRNQEPWKYQIPLSPAMKKKRKFLNFKRDYELIDGISQDKNEFSFTLSDNRKFTLSLLSGDVLDSSFDTSKVTSAPSRKEDKNKVSNVMNLITSSSNTYNKLSNFFDSTDSELDRSYSDSGNYSLTLDCQKVISPNKKLSLTLYCSIDTLTGEITANNNVETIIQMCKDLDKIRIPEKNLNDTITEVYICNSFTTIDNLNIYKPTLYKNGYKTGDYNTWFTILLGYSSYDIISLAYDPQSKIYAFTDTQSLPRRNRYFTISGEELLIKEISDTTHCSFFDPHDEILFPPKGYLTVNKSTTIDNMSIEKVHALLGTPDSIFTTCDSTSSLQIFKNQYLSRIYFYNGKVDVIQVKR